jgi:hypothetical protein
MKIRITAEYNVKETERGIDVLDDDGMCLCTGPSLQAAMNSLAGMVENEMLDPSVFTVEIINVIGGV